MYKTYLCVTCVITPSYVPGGKETVITVLITYYQFPQMDGPDFVIWPLNAWKSLGSSGG